MPSELINLNLVKDVLEPNKYISDKILSGISCPPCARDHKASIISLHLITLYECL